MTKIISLELNEINFEFIEYFVAEGKLPVFRRLLDEHGLVTTEAEKEYPLLEPWIQWPTVYTGKPYSEHGIFRLGDATSHNHIQIWDYLEQQGVRVGAISPMNAANRCQSPAFFVPDPWTETPATADPAAARLFECIKRIVNENASDRRSLMATARELLPLAAPYLSPSSASQYLHTLFVARKHKWARAAILDRLLADLFLSLWRETLPDYASLFLNAGAHIQHHYMYDSACYHGPRSNPLWYSSAAGSRVDPLLFIYQSYDAILRDFLALEDCRILITTGLSQFPNEREHYQYRLARPEPTLTRLGIENFRVSQLMSRDFLLTFPDSGKAASAEKLMAQVECRGRPFFGVDNRGASLFCQVRYHGPPAGLHEISLQERTLSLEGEVVLVSIENGLHRTLGYHLDTGLDADIANAMPRQPLETMFGKFVELALAGAGKEEPAALRA